jgi:plastocyanin
VVWVVALVASVSLMGAGALAQPRSAQATHTVNIVSKGVYGPYALSPKSISVAKGQAVTWANGSGTKHHLKFTNGTAWAKAVQAGQSVSRTFHAKGTFHYHCTIHPYMKGTVTVT